MNQRNHLTSPLQPLTGYGFTQKDFTYLLRRIAPVFRRVQDDLTFYIKEGKPFAEAHQSRRLAAVEMGPEATQKDVERFKKELEALRRTLGEDCLERIEKRVRGFRTEVIIAVENIAQNGGEGHE